MMEFIPPLVRSLAPLAIFLLLGSCENKELAAKREHQKLEIRRLEAEMAAMQAKLDDSIPDYHKDLEDTKDSLTRIKKEIVETEAEIVRLGEEKRELEKEFSDYQRAYPLPAKSNN